MKYIFCVTLLQIIWTGNVISQTVCADNTWVAYKDTKCFKIIDNLVTREDAYNRCKEEEDSNDPSHPPLLIIKSEDEQAFVANYIFNITGILDTAWLGARRQSGNVFGWDDGSQVEYSNWAAGSPSSDSQKQCVQLTSALSKKGNPQAAENGRWSDVACGRRNVIVCQKLQTWPVVQLQKAILEMRNEFIKKLEITEAELNRTKSNLQTTISNLQTTNSNLQTTKDSVQHLERNPVPIGFIYVQLYGQPTPSSLWPRCGWSEISSSYSGQFFRVVGGNAASFGTVQGDNAPRILYVTSQQRGGSGWIDLYENSWSGGYLHSGDTTGNPMALDFYTSGGEVRPVNQAMKLWKRNS